MSLLGRLVAALERETLAIREAVQAGDLTVGAQALQRRAETLSALERELPRSPDDDATAARAAAARALESDAELVAELSRERDEVRETLAGVRHAREVASRVARSDVSARFVCERV